LPFLFVIVHFTLRREILLIERKTGGVVDRKYILDAGILLLTILLESAIGFRLNLTSLKEGLLLVHVIVGRSPRHQPAWSYRRHAGTTT
jgi:hypothetical protein